MCHIAEQIILFGSQVKGRPHKYSDIDLAVVSSDFKKDNLDDIL